MKRMKSRKRDHENIKEKEGPDSKGKDQERSKEKSKQDSKAMSMIIIKIRTRTDVRSLRVENVIQLKAKQCNCRTKE